MNVRHLASLSFVVFAFGCSSHEPETQSQSQSQSQSRAQPQPQTQPAVSSRDSAAKQFGAPLSNAKPIPVAQLFEGAHKYAGSRLVVDGKVEAVCQSKGCWMTLTDGTEQMRVKFKDYGFFVPKGLSGRVVRAEGIFDIREVPEAERRHYLEDAGRFDDAKAVSGPERSYEFVATGVRILR